MRVREINNSKIAKFLGYNIVLWPYILYIGTPTSSIRLHEFTHIKQIKKNGLIKFYFLYLWYYLINLIKLKDHYDAYLAIPFEVEAYEFQDRYDQWLEQTDGNKYNSPLMWIYKK